MKIQFYAILKDYFSSQLEVDQPLVSVEELNDFLIGKNPSSKEIMDCCRFAVNDTFVDKNFQLHQHDVISILPPSSGG